MTGMGSRGVLAAGLAALQGGGGRGAAGMRLIRPRHFNGWSAPAAAAVVGRGASAGAGAGAGVHVGDTYVMTRTERRRQQRGFAAAAGGDAGKPIDMASAMGSFDTSGKAGAAGEGAGSGALAGAKEAGLDSSSSSLFSSHPAPETTRPIPS